MRISDWSSDVCSFDLVDLDVVVPPSPLVVQFEHPRPHLCVLRTGALVEAHACARSSERCSERQKDVVRRSNPCRDAIEAWTLMRSSRVETAPVPHPRDADSAWGASDRKSVV